MLVDCALYSDGKRESVGMAEAVRAASGVPGGFVWLGLHEPTYDEFDDLALYFAPHPLAIEDAINAHQRPKLDVYDECIFVVLKTLDYDEARAELITGEIMLFTGENFMVTVSTAATRSSNRSAAASRATVICCATALGRALRHLRTPSSTTTRRSLTTSSRSWKARGAGLRLGRAQTPPDLCAQAAGRRVPPRRRPLGHPMRVLTSARLAGIDAEMEPYFRDVADPLARVAEKVDGFDALLTDILTANLAQISILQNEESRQQNDDMRRISAWVALVAVDTVITGIYGMNFDYMPELHHRYAYFICLAVMLGLDLTLYRLFRRSGWL
jgi:magnesium transporter